MTATFEQLELFADQEPEPNPYEDTWWRPVQPYRYNENGRPSGWVTIRADQTAWVHYDEERKRLSVAYYSKDWQAARHWITEADLLQYFQQIPEPEWRTEQRRYYDS